MGHGLLQQLLQTISGGSWVAIAVAGGHMKWVMDGSAIAVDYILWVMGSTAGECCIFTAIAADNNRWVINPHPHMVICIIIM